MTAHADKTPENKSNAVANAVPRKTIGTGTVFPFADQRLAAVAQGKLQDRANKSARMKQLKAFQRMTHGPGSPVIQRYPPMDLGDIWFDDETGDQYVDEEDAITGYIKWKKSRDEEPNPEAERRLQEIHRSREAEKVPTEGSVVSEPMVFKQIQVGSQKVLLVGTLHGDSGTDLSSQIPDECLKNAAVILEYPPLRTMTRDTFTEKDIATVNDKTQAALAVRGAAKGQEGTVVIGADGRKSFVSKDEIQGVSLRHKQLGEFSVSPKLIEIGEIMELGTAFTMGALQLSAPTIGQVCVRLLDLVHYNATSLCVVLAQSSGHLRFLASQIKPNELEAVKQQVLSCLASDLQHAQTHHEEGLARFRKGGAGFKGSEADLIRLTNIERLSAFYDAVCNLMLFTEVLVSKKENIVVAFGNEHVKPLLALLEQFKAMRENQKW